MRTTQWIQLIAAAFLLMWPAAAEPAGAAQLELAPLPQVDLAAYDPEIRAVMEAARERIDQLLAADDRGDEQLARAYGNLGRAAIFYLQGGLAEAALRNAALLEPDEFRWHYYLGAHYHDERRLGEARGELERALELVPRDGAARLRLGRVLLLLDQTEAAETLFESLRERTPWAAAALHGLGQISARRQDFSGAVRYYQEALKIQPDAAELHQGLGLAYRQIGDVEAARKQLAERPEGELAFSDPLVETLGRDFANSAVYRGMAAASAGRFNDAAREYAKAVEGDPENAVYRQALGDVLSRLGDHDGAIRELREAVQLDPSAALARVSLGKALAERDGFSDEVVAEFEAARELAPGLNEVRAGLGQALAKLGRFEEASTEFEAALAADPEDAGSRLLWGEVLLILNRTAEALVQLSAARESLPDQPRLLVAYGRALAREGEDVKARDVLQQVVDSDTDTRRKALAHVDLAETLERLGEQETALLHFRSAADLLPEYKPTQLGLGWALARAGRHAEAAEVFGLVLLVDPSDLTAMRDRAQALVASGRAELALAELEAASSVTATPEGRAVLGLVHSALLQSAGQVDRAVELLEQLVEEQPDFKDAHFNLAVALGRGGRADRAIEHLERTIELDPQDAEAQLALAQLFAGGRRFAEARQTLERARRRLPENRSVTRALATLLVASPDRAVRDSGAALPLAMELYEQHPVAEHAALVAAALAGSQRLGEAVEWQTRAVEQAEAANAPERQLELMRRDLDRYRQGT